MRPAFFTLRGSKAFSGFQHDDGSVTTYRDIAEGLGLPAPGDGMVTLPDDVTPAWEIGARVVFVVIANYLPHAVVDAGEAGEVVALDTDAFGTIEIRLERHHPGLCDTENCVWLTPFTSEELLPGVLRCGASLPTTSAAA